jgi:CubicO group peptidase (beta-lactamase class C family)
MLLNRRLFIQQAGLGAAGFAGLPVASWPLQARARTLPRSLPEAQGVASSGVLDFISAVESARLNVHSLMLVRRGQVVAEGWWAPYAAHLKHTMYSLSKSFTSTAVGMAVAEGRLKVDDKVISFFPQDLPATISPNLAAMEVKHLLMMGSGHMVDALFGANFTLTEKNWVASILSRPVEKQPGTHFLYNNACTFLLSAIVQKVTGQTLLAYLTPRLFEPLGVEDADWELNPQGVNDGAWGLRVRTEDIAKLGQLYLQQGQWNGKRLLQEAWVKEASQFQIPNASNPDPSKNAASDWAQGYGYQFWRCRNEAFRGDGAFGQYCIVAPKQDAVIAMTSETSDMQAILNAVWTHLLPAMKNDKLAPDSKAASQLKQKLSSLTLALPVGQNASPVAARVDKKVFSIADNSLSVNRVSLAFERDKSVFTMNDAKGAHRIVCGAGRWLEGFTDLSAAPVHMVTTAPWTDPKIRIAAAGAWSDENTFVMNWRFTETAHYQTVTCRFDGENIQVEFKRSVTILNPNAKETRPILTGKLQTKIT